jgi:hypothetical protein
VPRLGGNPLKNKVRADEASPARDENEIFHADKAAQ